MADITVSNSRYSNIETCPSSGGGTLVRVLRKTTPPNLTPFTFISSDDAPSTLSAAPRQSDIKNIQHIANESGALGVCQQQVNGGYGLFLRYGNPELALRMLGNNAAMAKFVDKSNGEWLELDLDLPSPSGDKNNWVELDLDNLPSGPANQKMNKAQFEVLSAHRWTERDGKNPEAWTALSEAYMSVKHFGEARAAAQFAAILSPDCARAHHLLGKAKLALGANFFELGPSENATSLLAKAAELNPESIEIRIDLARSLTADGNVKASQIEFMELMNMAIENRFRIDDDTLFFFASSAYEARNYHIAIKALKKISIEFHSYSYSRFLLGVALIATAERSQAASALRHAANIVQSPTYETALGMVLLLNGEYDQSIIHLNRATDALGEMASDDLRFAICLAHIALKNSGKAVDSLKEYIETLLKGNSGSTKELGLITTALIKQYPEWSARVLRMTIKRVPNHEKLGGMLELSIPQTEKDEANQFAGFIDQSISDVLSTEQRSEMLGDNATTPLDSSHLLFIGEQRFVIPAISICPQVNSPTSTTR